MRQAHEEVIALHGIPVEGEGMLVVVALMLLDEEARFDAPTVASTEVAALMDILAAERLAGEPGVARRFGHDPGLLIDPLPAFLTDHHVQLEPATSVRTLGIFDVIDPAEVLLALSPVLPQGLGKRRGQIFPFACWRHLVCQMPNIADTMGEKQDLRLKFSPDA